MHRRIVPDVVRDQSLCLVASDISVREAAQTMAKRRIGAVMVTDGARLVGIFTERDILTRVVAPGLDPNATRVAEVMTRDPDTIGPDETALDAVQMMRRSGYRHLPVVDGERIVGMVSVRDLYAAAVSELEDEVAEREQFIHGTGYGIG